MGDRGDSDDSALDPAVSRKYENVEIFRRSSDPFGEAFEKDLASAPVLPARRTKAKNNPTSSYDEISFRSGRPVILSSGGALDDVVFDSPLRETPKTTTPVPTPVPAPRFSKMSKDETEEAPTIYDNNQEIIYEELLPKEAVVGQGEERGAIRPEVPRRNDAKSVHLARSSCTEEQTEPKRSSASVEEEDDVFLEHDHNSNVYSEVCIIDESSSTSSANAAAAKRKSILDDGILDVSDYDCPSPALVPPLLDQSSDQKSLLLCKQKLTTIDFRREAHKLFEMAVQDFHRDKNLVEGLEQREMSEKEQFNEVSSGRTDQKKQQPQQHSYDSVAIPEQRFKIVNGVQVPIPLTILKAFDPCFDAFPEEEEEDTSSTSSSSSHRPSNANSINDNDQVAEAQNYSEPFDSVIPRVSSGSSRQSLSSSREDATTKQSTTSISSMELPPPTDPPPEPNLDRFSNQHPYENVWIPPEKGGNPVIEGDNVEKNIAAVHPKCRSDTVPNEKKSVVKRHSSLRTSEVAQVEAAVTDVDSKTNTNLSVASPDGSSSKTKNVSMKMAPQFLKDVHRSASSSNLSFITKKLSFSKFTRKISDVQKPKEAVTGGVAAASLPEEQLLERVRLSDGGSGQSGSSPMRRKSSLLVETTSSFPGTRNHSGPLQVFGKGRKPQERWCVLGNGSLCYYSHKDSMAEPKQTILLKDVSSLFTRIIENGSDEGDILYTFDVAFVAKFNKLSIRTFASISDHTRDAWMDKLAQSLTSFRMLESDPYNSPSKKLGWMYLKSMFAGKWYVSWLSLRGRFLHYSPKEGEEDQSENVVDLKKIKNVTLVREVKNLNAMESSLPAVVVDFVDQSLYLQASSERECLHWRSCFEDVAFNNSNALADQQLTQDGIPAVIHSCADFVFRHGCMTEGIYRHSGVKTKIDSLLVQFRQNAWGVALTRDEFSEHDVANALKRFMRTLEEPLLTEALRRRWMATAKLQPLGEKLKSYSQLLAELPALNARTLRRLIGHLRSIGAQGDRNLMPAHNLAAIWGPTLLTVDGQETPADFVRTSAEADICKDLIDNYANLFDVSPEEMEREERIVRKTKSFNRNPNPVKVSGEVMMFVYVDTRTSGHCVSIAVTPKMTAHELRRRALEKASTASCTDEENFDDENDDFVLHEVVLGGAMERPIHHAELIYEVTLKWCCWPQDDRSHTYLLLKRRGDLLREVLPLCAKPPLSVFGEAFYAESARKSASFKKFHFSVNNAKITRCREHKSSAGGATSDNSNGSGVVQIESWDIEKVIWYIGCDPRRPQPPPYNLNVTFIEKGEDEKTTKRTKERSHYFGRTISFPSRELFVKWVAAMLVAEYPNNMVPQENLLNIDDD